MPIKNYTTKVSFKKSIGEITEILVSHGARQIMMDYTSDGHAKGVYFSIETPLGTQLVRLPSNIDRVMSVLNSQKVKCDYDHAENVAWRILRDWIYSQMAILETQMISVDQVFLPYFCGKNGETVYQLYNREALLIEGKKDI